MSSSAAWLIEHHKNLQQGNCGCSSPNSTCSKICVNFRVETLACFGHTRWRLWYQLGEERVLIRFLWQQSHNGFQKRKGLHALLLLFQSFSLLAHFLRQASAAHQGHLDLYMSPLRRHSNIYVSFEEVQQYICLLWGGPTIYMSPLRRPKWNNTFKKPLKKYLLIKLLFLQKKHCLNKVSLFKLFFLIKQYWRLRELWRRFSFHHWTFLSTWSFAMTILSLRSFVFMERWQMILVGMIGCWELFKMWKLTPKSIGLAAIRHKPQLKQCLCVAGNLQMLRQPPTWLTNWRALVLHVMLLPLNTFKMMSKMVKLGMKNRIWMTIQEAIELRQEQTEEIKLLLQKSDPSTCTHPLCKRYGNRHGRYSLCQRCGRWDHIRNGWEIHGHPSSSGSSALPPPSLESILPPQGHLALKASTAKPKCRPSTKRGAYPLPIHMGSQASEMSWQDKLNPEEWGDPEFLHPDSENPDDAPQPVMFISKLKSWKWKNNDFWHGWASKSFQW